LNTAKKVLVAPLDWGLGHATRCIPIVNELLLQGFEVVLGAEDSIASLFKVEFPALKIILLKGYKVAYSRQKMFFLWKMLVQIPKIFFAIKNENKWLTEIIETHKIDIVLSDNRFGLYNKNAHCIFITHQLNIKTGNRFTEKIAQKINYNYINKYNECWIIDDASKNNLAGSLSHPEEKPAIPLHYISALSRFKYTSVEKTNDLLMVLSGPEPQRTIFENILLAQIKNLKIKMTLVRGLPNELLQLKNENSTLSILNHCNAEELNKIILSSKIIISRSGYTSVMDYAILQQKVIYVPTPGQTEQEYLAKYLSEKKYAVTSSQLGFDITTALKVLSTSTLLPYPVFNETALVATIKELQ
jgi:uncharacterized protein (TIGR00661 family)